MKISRHQFDPAAIGEITYEDMHIATEDDLAVYRLGGKRYVVVEAENLTEADGSMSVLVVEWQGVGKLAPVLDEETVKKVLALYEEDD